MDRRELKTKNDIKKATLSLLNKKNIYELTVKEICEEANIGRSTFYLHYEDINNLIENIEDDGLKDVIELCILYRNERIENLCQIVSKYIKKNKNLYKILILKTNNHFENKLKNKFENIFLSLFLQSNKTFFTKYYLSFVINGSIGVVKDWILDDCQIDESLLINEFMNQFKKDIN